MEQFIANGLCHGAVYSLLAVAFATTCETSRVFHFAFAATSTAGAYAAWATLEPLGLPLIAALASSTFVGGGIGVLIQRVAYDPISGSSGSPTRLLLSSIGANTVLQSLIALIFGYTPRFLHGSFNTTYQVGSILIAQPQLCQILVGAAASAVFVLIIVRSPMGLLIRAVADDDKLAALFTIEGTSTRAKAAALSSAAAGLAGALYAIDSGVDPTAGFDLLLIAAIAFIVGGSRSLLGACLAGLLLGTLEGLVAWSISSQWTKAANFVVLALALLLRRDTLLVRPSRPDEP